MIIWIYKSRYTFWKFYFLREINPLWLPKKIIIFPKKKIIQYPNEKRKLDNLK